MLGRAGNLIFVYCSASCVHRCEILIFVHIAQNTSKGVFGSGELPGEINMSIRFLCFFWEGKKYIFFVFWSAELSCIWITLQVIYPPSFSFTIMLVIGWLVMGYYAGKFRFMPSLQWPNKIPLVSTFFTFISLIP